MMSEKTSKWVAVNNDTIQGLLIASLSIPVGMVLWLVLWKLGFMSALVSFVIAFLTIFLYKLGSKQELSKNEILPLTAIILLGVILSFMTGMMSDAWDVFSKEYSGYSFFSSTFFNFFFTALSNEKLWDLYIGDIIIAILFAALGTWTIFRDLLKTTKTNSSQQSNVT